MDRTFYPKEISQNKYCISLGKNENGRLNSYCYTSINLLDYLQNKYPPDNPVVFHSRAEISPLLPAACITGECGPPLASFTCYP